MQTRYTLTCTVVYMAISSMARTNIDIDDELLEKAIEVYGFRTKKEAVDTALEELIGGRPMTLDQALAMEGSGWEGEIDWIPIHPPANES